MSEELNVQNEQTLNSTEEDSLKQEFGKVFQDTHDSLDKIVDSRFYPDIMNALKSGQATIELRKRCMLKAVDEIWINAIEDVLPSVEALMKSPRKYIEEQEYVLPISQSKAIAPKSVRHLAQHVDFISRIEGDTVIPSKILNIFREETMLTYENKFVNTLIKKLYLFVSRRYDEAAKHPLDSISTTLSFKESFKHDDILGKINLQIELEEPANNFDVENNYTYYSGIWHRVVKLNDVCSGFLRSDFCKNMGDAVVKPPIVHTNAIMKNKDLKQALALYEFIESYENAGYSLLVDEHLESIDEDYINCLYKTMSIQYLIFRSKLHGAFKEDKTLDKSDKLSIFTPDIVEDLEPTHSEEFDGHFGKTLPLEPRDKELTELDHRMLAAIEEALQEAEKELRNAELNSMLTIQRSFLSRIIQGTVALQDYYSEIKNHLLEYKGMNQRISWGGEAFNIGRKKYANLIVKGKTLIVYFALDPKLYPQEKYHHKDVSGKSSKLSKTPTELRITSDRSFNYCLFFIDEMLKNVEKDPDFVKGDFGMPYESDSQLVSEGLIKVTNGEIPEDEKAEKNDAIKFTTVADSMFDKHPKRSFTAKLIQSDDTIKAQYGELKNAILSYKKVKARVSFSKEAFSLGRDKLATILFKGKKIAILLAINPENYDASKYHHKLVKSGDYPTQISITSARQLKNAIELVGELMKTHEIPFALQQNEDYYVPYEDDDALIAKGLIKIDDRVKVQKESRKISGLLPGFEYTFVATMTLASEYDINLYNLVKNKLLSGVSVCSKMGAYYESFNKGRTIIARLSVKDGVPYCFLALNSEEINEYVCPFRLFEDVDYLKDTPVAVELNSEESVNNLCKLISTSLFPKYNIVDDKKYKEEKFEFEKKSFEELYDEGLIIAKPEEIKEPTIEDLPEIKPLIDFETTESDKAFEESEKRKDQEDENEADKTEKIIEDTQVSVEETPVSVEETGTVEESVSINEEPTVEEPSISETTSEEQTVDETISEEPTAEEELKNSEKNGDVLVEIDIDESPNFELDDESSDKLDESQMNPEKNDEIEFIQQELPVEMTKEDTKIKEKKSFKDFFKIKNKK